MAKTIKFNLICDGNPVRTIDDLKENFAIEDVLSYYENELLHRWLNVRGYDEILDKVNKISSTSALEIIKELISIFEIETNLSNIEKNTYILQYKRENEMLLEEYRKMGYKTSNIIDDYYAGYTAIIDSIIENKDDMAKIKACISELEDSYIYLLSYNYRELFYKLLDNAPMGIFAILMNETLRYLYLPKPTSVGEKITEVFSTVSKILSAAIINAKNTSDSTIEENVLKNSIQLDEDKKIMLAKITSLVSNTTQLQSILGENLKEFAGVTDGYWKDVETKDKKYMLLKMESGNYARATGISGGDMGSTDVNNKFIIVDGIDYKSNNASHKLLYLEV